MANFCINHDDLTYKLLQEMTGIPEPELDILVEDYYLEYGEFPTVDHFLNEADTKEHLLKAYGIDKHGKVYGTSDGNIVNPIVLNTEYRDLEVDARDIGNGKQLIHIKRRALPNRTLKTKKVLPLPMEVSRTSEVQPVWTNGKYFIFSLNGNFYKTDCRIADAGLLVGYPCFSTMNEAIFDNILLQPQLLDSEVISVIQNSNRLNSGQEIRVKSNTRLPQKFKLFTDFDYPKFIFNQNINQESQIIDGVININPTVINDTNPLEKILLKALGYNTDLVETLFNMLQYTLEYETISDINGEYIIRKVDSEFNLLEISEDPKKIETDRNNIELLLDRLESLYGITFKRVTNQDILDSNLRQLISDATLVHAFILNGEIYINMDNITSDAPIHELSHILLGSLRQTNPELYIQLVSSVELLEDYSRRLSLYPNRARMDVNEEIFVDLFAKHYTEGLDLKIDPTALKKAEYEIKRNIDSAIFPDTSTTNTSMYDLLNRSFEEIMDIFGTAINRDNLTKAFNSPDGFNTRYTANLKQRLLENGDLKEYCN